MTSLLAERPTPIVVQRLTWLLFFGQSLGSAGLTAGFTVSTIVGAQLSGQAALAGVPSAAYLLGNALGAYPAARWMERAGRRPGLTFGFALGVVGAVIAGMMIVLQSFVGFLTGFTLMGLARGFTDLARYAAADMHAATERGRAISLVVLGGTVGAVLGPALVKISEPFIANEPLAGAWFVSAALFVIAMLAVGVFLRPDPRDLGRELVSEHREAAITDASLRPLRDILRQPGMLVALSAMVLGQLVMVMLMGITSLHMKHHGHELGDVSLVIMAHTLGMFGLSMVSGRLADRLGRAPTIMLGGGLLIIACVFARVSQNTAVLAAALFLLGLGWNLCYVAGGALLTDTLTVAERGRLQGGTDLLIGLVSALGSLVSGAIFAALGYTVISGISLIVTLIPLLMALRFNQSRLLAQVAETSS